MAVSKPFDYRRHLLRAVRGFLQATAASRARAHRIVAACPRTKSYTIEDMVWGAILSELQDSVFYESPAYLEELQRFLEGGSGLIKRGYISYDLRPQMMPQEQAWYQELDKLLDFLGHFPFADVEEAKVEYDRGREVSGALLANLAESSQGSGESLYRLVLHEVSAVALNIDIRKSVVLSKRLTPSPDYLSVYPYSRLPLYPDATPSVQWARRALQAIAGQDWLYVSWQIKQQELCFALH